MARMSARKSTRSQLALRPLPVEMGLDAAGDGGEGDVGAMAADGDEAGGLGDDGALGLDAAGEVGAGGDDAGAGLGGLLVGG
jgi:hypothetical protein